MNEKVLVALGGNAILKHREQGTAEEQFDNVRTTCQNIAKLILKGYKIAITHGNGPQVGDILLRNDLSKNTLPPMPLDVCGAESQGMLGYMLQQSMYNALKSAGIHSPIATILTQTVVHMNDQAFQHPTKPIGPFYTAMEATKYGREKGWTIVNDGGRGYRRVVPSPNPISIVEEGSIKKLFNQGVVVIACGGGGIPVVAAEDGTFHGVEAVIDKDHCAAILAKAIGAEILLVLTDVKKVALNFGRPNQEDLDHMTVEEARKYSAEGHFLPGSMGPKIESAIDFLESGGKKTVITSLELAVDALEGRAGTTIFK
jgi:carbamate kinase